MPRTLANPALPGFNPDPSIVLVDGVYTLVTSTFEYLPGLPVYTSTDLVTWTHASNVVTRESQLDFEDVPTPGGAWAPTIRYRDGLYWVIVSMMFSGRGCMVFTADDPRGPWSDGRTIAGIDGIDPDLAWDDDGTAYVTWAHMGKGILQCAVDLDACTTLEEPRSLWSGTGLHAPEGPHLYRRGDAWYLLLAEGGTERGHAISIARGSSPRGPFTGNPENPFLSARSTAGAVQNLGHADLVATDANDTVMVLLGVRPVGFTRSFSPLGRETFIVPVRWVDGWPVAEPPQLSELSPAIAHTYDLTDAATLLDPGWLAVRRQPDAVVSEIDSRRGIMLVGDGATLSDPCPTFLGRRQQFQTSTASVILDVTEGTGGIAARHAERHWFGIEASSDAEGTLLTTHAVLSAIHHVEHTRIAPGPCELRITSRTPNADAAAMEELRVGGDRITLSVVTAAGEQTLAEYDGRYWSFETTESFTGRVVGVFATQGIVYASSFTIDTLGSSK